MRVVFMGFKLRYVLFRKIAKAYQCKDICLLIKIFLKQLWLTAKDEIYCSATSYRFHYLNDYLYSFLERNHIYCTYANVTCEVHIFFLVPNAACTAQF